MYEYILCELYWDQHSAKVSYHGIIPFHSEGRQKGVNISVGFVGIK